MKDLEHDRLFDNVDNLARIARDRRRMAIDAHPRLAYIVRLRDDTGRDQELTFATSPEFGDIQREARAAGILGQVHILDVTVRATKPRPLVLMPWDRVREGRVVAAE
jgi:hypothetical protein